MSNFNVLLDELEKCSKKLDELISIENTGPKTLKKSLEIEIGQLFADIEKNLPGEVIIFLEKIYSAEEGEEEGIVKEFRTLDNQIRHILIKVNEINWKIGLKEDESDVDRREKWYELLKSNC